MVCACVYVYEAIEDLYILVLAKSGDLPVGFWCGLCGIGSTCTLILLGVSVADNFSVF